jgi:hypothetical protein
MPERKKPAVKREGPSPAHVLIGAIRRAVAAGVDQQKLLIMLDQADEATGTDQAPAWRNVTRTLNRWSSELDGQPASEPEKTSEVAAEATGA